MREFDVEKLEWLLQNLDVNLIEHLWEETANKTFSSNIVASEREVKNSQKDTPNPFWKPSQMNESCCSCKADSTR